MAASPPPKRCGRSACCAAARGWPAGCGYRTRNALLADSVAPSAYGRAKGFERAMDDLNAIVGPPPALGMAATDW